ncbi:MAG: site-2 protease family protein [Anaerolineales bacterium]|nr:site-2 protease family protein [Anaerolineales bacterium]
MEQIKEEQGIVERLLPAVNRVMIVQDMTSGGINDQYSVRYRGKLIRDSEQAYSDLEPIFSEEGMTLVFRSDEDADVILGLEGVHVSGPSNPWINIGLFVLTLGSMMLAGALDSPEAPALIEQYGPIMGAIRALPIGLPFAISLLAILLAHEFGHYLAARYHNHPVTLPYFIPLPISYFGTMGAFIRLKAPPRNRRVLHDIGIAGPLAGLVLAIPILLYGLSISEVGPIWDTIPPGWGIRFEGNSIFYLASKYIVTGQLLPAPADYGGVNPLIYWVRYFFTGLPAPFGGVDVTLHPIAWAGWAGLLVTSLNLIPAGQLDGGHVLYVLWGKGARRLWPFIVVALVALGFIWSGWWIWALLIFFLGRTYAQPLDDITPLDPGRRSLALFGILIFFLVFIPIPLRFFWGV